MTNVVKNSASIDAVNASVLAVGGWSIADMREAAAEAVINRYRFVDQMDRILSQYEDVPCLMPSTDELSAMGVDVVGLAGALEAGLDARLFGQVVHMLDIASFNRELSAGLSIAHFNEGMEHLADIASAHDAHPDFVDEVLCRHGDCCADLFHA